MKDELITFETAKLAKEKGFNIPTWFFYFKGILVDKTTGENDSSTFDENISNWNDGWNFDHTSAPTQSLLQRWLREKHDTHIELVLWNNNSWSCQVVNDVFAYEEDGSEYEAYGCKSYEEALEEGLQAALKLIQNG